MKNHRLANLVNTLHWEKQGLSRETAGEKKGGCFAGRNERTMFLMRNSQCIKSIEFAFSVALLTITL